MEVNSIQNHYYINASSLQQSAGANVVAAELGAIDAKSAFPVHDLEKVEHPTETKQIFKTDNILSIYNNQTPELTKDFYKVYMGLNF